MPAARPFLVSDTSEEGRALLQSRVALFWKVLFFISLFSGAIGAFGAIVKPNGDMWAMVALSVQNGVCWRLSARGQPSAGSLRAIEAGGLLINVAANAMLGRYVVLAFVREHGFVSPEGALMTDAYITMLHIGGIGLLLAIRAALVPSAPRYTALLTAVVGAPLVASVLIAPSTGGPLAFRPLDSAAFPWMPMTGALLWGFVMITCTVTSWVIYGLRAEMREARRLGQYVLEQKIGEGGMGEVYRASHGMMRRPSALKLLKAGDRSPSSLARFEREVQLTARLTHPNTITIFDYGRTHDGVFYYAMELLDGATLQRIVAVSGKQPAGRVMRILTMACGALSEAHATGLIHRDIKPANIMLCKQGGEEDVVKLLDFGLVKELEMAGETKLTGANTITGTPQYMAPESILEPDSADARTDIYALGAVAYYLLAGRDVFKGSSIVEICGKHIHEKPEPFSAHGVTVSADLEAIVLACLEKKPDDRPSSTADLRRRLEACNLPSWQSEDAATWWKQHQAALAQPAPPDAASTTRAITIAGRPAA